MKQVIRNQRLFFVSLIGIVSVSLIMGTTYAYQTLQVDKTSGSNTNVTLNVGKLNVTFNLKCKDGEVCDKTNDNYDRINLSNMPLSTNYKNAEYVEFTLKTNDTTEDVAYQINLSDIDYGYIEEGTKISGCRELTQTLQAACIVSENFKYTVVEVTSAGENVLAEGNFNDLSNSDYLLTLQSNSYNFIEQGKTQTIRLYLWLQETEEDQNILENTYFNAKIEINSYFLSSIMINYPENTLAYKMLENAQNIESDQVQTRGAGDTAYNAVYKSTPLTKPAKEINNIDESTLSATIDNLGLSYYYRGNVKNNYINFASRCWRIVRIQGDGSIKLILEDLYAECDDTTENDKNTDGIVYTGQFALTRPITNAIFGGNFGYTEYTANSLTASNGKTNSSTVYIMNYLNGGTNNKYSMATTFKEFEAKLTATEKSKLKPGNWCLENNVYDSSNNLLNTTEIMDKKINNNSLSYSSHNRIFNLKDPNLKCTGIVLNYWDDNDSNSSPMYVSAITAEEVLFAGATADDANQNYYLINDEFKKGSSGVNKYNYFWTFTPDYFKNNNDHAIAIRHEGYFSHYIVRSSGSVVFRPVVSLLPNSLFNNGDGTKEYPYTIQ